MIALRGEISRLGRIEADTSAYLAESVFVFYPVVLLLGEFLVESDLVGIFVGLSAVECF